MARAIDKDEIKHTIDLKPEGWENVCMAVVEAGRKMQEYPKQCMKLVSAVGRVRWVEEAKSEADGPDLKIAAKTEHGWLGIQMSPATVFTMGPSDVANIFRRGYIRATREKGDPLLHGHEVAELLDMGIADFYEMQGRKAGPPFEQDGPCVVYRKSALEEWMESRES